MSCASFLGLSDSVVLNPFLPSDGSRAINWLGLALVGTGNEGPGCVGQEGSLVATRDQGPRWSHPVAGMHSLINLWTEALSGNQFTHSSLTPGPICTSIGTCLKLVEA